MAREIEIFKGFDKKGEDPYKSWQEMDLDKHF